MAFGRLKPGSHMMRFALQNLPSCRVGDELEGDKKIDVGQ